MNSKIFVALAIVAAIAGLESKVQAQSTVAQNSKAEDYTIQGNSLVGIDSRTAEDDFPKFFAGQNSPNNVSRKNFGESIPPADVLQLGDQVELRRREPLRTPNNVFFPQGDESFYSNDGVQVQLDLDNNK
ncbi:MAG: hypothetical protein KME30_17955 [Iphinoe sp. HA4291-MV1]|jgi:hypothetical protein|nr:hypothetical protein [Iphinoe sp. HA4291-MV1]